MRLTIASAPLALVLVLLTACSSTPMRSDSAPVEDRNANAASNSSAPNTVAETPVATVTPEANATQNTKWPELRDPNNILSKRSIYFDFDKYTIRDEFKSTIEAHARFLVSHPDAKVLIQGNADERGSREYNLALGQKRADATRQALTLLGAKETQIESVSLGEEKPKNSGHDEKAYSENRRSDILYNGEY